MKVALLDSNHVALSIARSLRNKGIAVDVLHLTGPSIADWSHCVDRVVRLPSATDDMAAHADALLRHLQQTLYDLLIPVSDAAVVVCRHLRKEISGLVTIAMSDEATLAISSDKLATARLAESLGVPVPNGQLIASGEEDRVGDLVTTYPCYLKPSRSVVVLNNRLVRFSVRRADNLMDVKRYCYSTANSNPVIVQQQILGKGAGVYLIAEHGKVLAMACQYRLHEPQKGGPGSYRVSAPVPEQLAEYTRRLIAAVGYHGVAMVEFKGDPVAQRWHLMEINNRFWGSLPLTLSSGLDMPYWLVQLSFDKKTAIPAHLQVLPMRQRDLKRDLGWLTLRLISGPARLSRLLNYMGDLKYLAKGEEKIDYLDWRDPLPFLVDWVFLLKRLRRKTRPRVERLVHGLSYRRKKHALLATARIKLKSARPNILFVCYGNICRSPFAEWYLKDRYHYQNVKSAGVHPVTNRLSPPELQEVANTRFDIDLSEHRSTLLDDELVSWADMVIAMNYNNLADLKCRNLGGAAVLLGSFADVGPIRDPYGKSTSIIEDVLNKIALSVDKMMADQLP